MEHSVQCFYEQSDLFLSCKKVQLGILTWTKVLGLEGADLKREKKTHQIFRNTLEADKSHCKFKHYLALHRKHTNKWL